MTLGASTTAAAPEATSRPPALTRKLRRSMADLLPATATAGSMRLRRSGDSDPRRRCERQPVDQLRASIAAVRTGQFVGHVAGALGSSLVTRPSNESADYGTTFGWGPA